MTYSEDLTPLPQHFDEHVLREYHLREFLDEPFEPTSFQLEPRVRGENERSPSPSEQSSVHTFVGGFAEEEPQEEEQT
jgi:hypothetical protein